MTLTLDGELCIHRANELQQQLLPALVAARDDGGALLLDLSQVTEIDSAGVQLLELARREAGRQRSTVRLIAPSATVQQTLALLGLSERFLSAGEPAQALARAA